ncbi:DNA replication/repair protein RecF [Thalassorhabdus alkalitolerans]|uniref:DNA replication and repair protein RecF n=1 Tax=Thalassorhabdus alkalitolerans TaxID=2282697 RepID=A0ABW0YIZ8_9BACI
MHIESLYLKQYRNYEELTLQFENKINVIIGENAQGKTNLMEAIYVLAFTKSHRTPREKELINWDEDFARIHAQLSKSSGPFSLEVILSKKGKKVKYNELEQRKLSEYIGACNVVMFAPEDLNLVKGAPQVRRRFIDMEIGQISSVYLHDLAVYHRILKQRNQLLKDMFSKSGTQADMMLEVLTEQLIKAAAKLVERRFHFLNMLEKWAKTIHKEISRGKEELILSYVPTAEVSEGMELSMIEEEYKQAFGKVRDNEKRRGVTLVGPHREDIKLTVNDRNVQTYGSQGQQRTTALSLKLAEIELIRENIGEYPILLLDDVLSELDDHRQSHLLNTIQGKVQTFVTTTSVEGIEHETLKQASMFYVEDGRLQQKK